MKADIRPSGEARCRVRAGDDGDWGAPAWTPTPRALAAVRSALKAVYERSEAPVVRFARLRTREPFRVLVAALLSARTKDETTTRVCERLFAAVRAPADFRRYSAPELERMLRPVGFFRTKARHLLLLGELLEREFGGRVPDSLEALCRLPGVGRKTANLVLAEAFGRPAVCVDIHVHRICNRLGLVRTADPFGTEMALRSLLPRAYWRTWNPYLVSFGQTLCLPVNPRCDRCPIRRHCRRVGVVTRHSA